MIIIISYCVARSPFLNMCIMNQAFSSIYPRLSGTLMSRIPCIVYQRRGVRVRAINIIMNIIVQESLIKIAELGAPPQPSASHVGRSLVKTAGPG